MIVSKRRLALIERRFRFQRDLENILPSRNDTEKLSTRYSHDFKLVCSMGLDFKGLVELDNSRPLESHSKSETGGR